MNPSRQDIQDVVVRQANSLPDLIARAQQSAPELADQLTGKPIAQSKTVWGMLVTLGLVYLLRHWGLQYDENTLDIISGCIVMGATTLLRYISESPITSWFRRHVG